MEIPRAPVDLAQNTFLPPSASVASMHKSSQVEQSQEMDLIRLITNMQADPAQKLALLQCVMQQTPAPGANVAALPSASMISAESAADANATIKLPTVPETSVVGHPQDASPSAIAHPELEAQIEEHVAIAKAAKARAALEAEARLQAQAAISHARKEEARAQGQMDELREIIRVRSQQIAGLLHQSSQKNSVVTQHSTGSQILEGNSSETQDDFDCGSEAAWELVPEVAAQAEAKVQEDATKAKATVQTKVVLDAECEEKPKANVGAERAKAVVAVEALELNVQEQLQEMMAVVRMRDQQISGLMKESKLNEAKMIRLPKSSEKEIAPITPLKGCRDVNEDAKGYSQCVF